tara:strand:+ start:653 stop:805 length:153 start_codon:yes stop_codon:yes gene_type:complete
LEKKQKPKAKYNINKRPVRQDIKTSFYKVVLFIFLNKLDSLIEKTDYLVK